VEHRWAFTCTYTLNLPCVIHAHGKCHQPNKTCFRPPVGLPLRQKSHCPCSHLVRPGRFAVLFLSSLGNYDKKDFCLAEDSVPPHTSAWSRPRPLKGPLWPHIPLHCRSTCSKVWLAVYVTDQPRVHLHLAPAHGACSKLPGHRDALLLVRIVIEMATECPELGRGRWRPTATAMLCLVVRSQCHGQAPH
jgi:hypothetical protein